MGRSKSSNLTLTVILVCLMFAGLLAPSKNAAAQDATPFTRSGLPAGAEQAQALSAPDGDSIRVSINDRTTAVNLIGIYAPTGDDCFADEATAALDELVRDRTVYLESDTNDRDADKQRVRYVWVDLDGAAVLVNELLVRQGFAVAAPLSPNDAHDDDISDAQTAAQTAETGLWSACDQPPVPPAPPANQVTFSSGEGWSFTYDSEVWTIHERAPGFISLDSAPSSVVFSRDPTRTKASECVTALDAASDNAPASYYAPVQPIEDTYAIDTDDHFAAAYQYVGTGTGEEVIRFLDCRTLTEAEGLLMIQYYVSPPSSYEAEIDKRLHLLSTVQLHDVETEPTAGGTGGIDKTITLPFFEAVADEEWTAQDVAAGSSDPAATLAKLDDWGWYHSTYRRYLGSGAANTGGVTDIEVVTIDLDTEEAASEALDYFSAERTTLAGLSEIEIEPVGDRIIALSGRTIVEHPANEQWGLDGYEVSIFVQIGSSIARVTAVSPSEMMPMDRVAILVVQDLIG